MHVRHYYTSLIITVHTPYLCVGFFERVLSRFFQRPLFTHDPPVYPWHFRTRNIHKKKKIIIHGTRKVCKVILYLTESSRGIKSQFFAYSHIYFYNNITALNPLGTVIGFVHQNSQTLNRDFYRPSGTVLKQLA